MKTSLKKKKQQFKLAGDLKFEKAAELRDEIKALTEILIESNSGVENI